MSYQDKIDRDSGLCHPTEFCKRAVEHGKEADKELEAKDKLIRTAFKEGYELGHDNTVEGYYCPEEATDDYISDLTKGE